MCVKLASFFFLLFCFFMHASTSTAPSSPLPNTAVSHSTKAIHTQKIEEEKHYKVDKFGRNGRPVTMLSKSTDLCNKYNYKAIKQGTSGAADCKSSPQKALLQFSKSQDSRSRWAHDLNVRETDSSSIFSEENLSETDYQPPHRKSPIHNK